MVILHNYFEENYFIRLLLLFKLYRTQWRVVIITAPGTTRAFLSTSTYYNINVQNKLIAKLITIIITILDVNRFTIYIFGI